MSAPRVSELQRELLISLHWGWRWGGDPRSELGLARRGLVEMRVHYIAGDLTRPTPLPWLTPAGAKLAAELWLAAPLAEKREARIQLEELHEMGLHPPRFPLTQTPSASKGLYHE